MNITTAPPPKKTKKTKQLDQKTTNCRLKQH